MQTDLIQLCRRWSEATPGPPSASPPLPDVPALLLEGELDLRTPLEGAQRVAAQLPRATLVTIPATGHSTLGSDASSCTLEATTRFLRGALRAGRLRGPEPPARPDRPAPASLEEVAPVPRVPARPAACSRRSS